MEVKNFYVYIYFDPRKKMDYVYKKHFANLRLANQQIEGGLYG